MSHKKIPQLRDFLLLRTSVVDGNFCPERNIVVVENIFRPLLSQSHTSMRSKISGRFPDMKVDSVFSDIGVDMARIRKMSSIIGRLFSYLEIN